MTDALKLLAVIVLTIAAFIGFAVLSAEYSYAFEQLGHWLLICGLWVVGLCAVGWVLRRPLLALAVLLGLAAG